MCDSATLWTNCSLSGSSSRHEYWSELQGPSPGDISHPGIEPTSLSLFFFFLSSTSLLLPTHLPPLSSTHAQSCNPLGFSPPDSSVHGLFQARILEWVAISFSRTHISYISFFGFFSAPWEAPFKTKFFQVFKQNEKQPIQSQ